MNDVKPLRYGSEQRAVWNDFVKSSKNGTFLFDRGYMDYHADRFRDHSLLFFCDNKPVALLPANEHENRLVSHGGLTYGGFVSDRRMSGALMLDVVSALKTYVKRRGLRGLLYKAVPYFYHRLPAQEDLYALFRHGARLVRADISTTVDLSNPPALSKGRKHGISKARKAGLEVRESRDFAAFFDLLRERLKEKYQTQATHQLDEILLLAERFPEHIRLFAAFEQQTMQAAALIYDCQTVAHTQYLTTSARGRELGALDLLIAYLLRERYADRRFFDFGTSTEDQGRTLNQGLIAQKEMFGGRATVHQTFELEF